VTLWVAWLDDAGRQQRCPLVRALSAGRGPECTVRLAPRNVSRRHARFLEEDEAVWVEDLGSRNGTFVNGVRVRGRAAVAAGDEIRIADEALRVEEVAAAEPETEPCAPARTPPPLPGRRPASSPGAAPDPADATSAMPAAAPAASPRGWRAAIAALRSLARRRA
jgi:predicted component of type VI protein secretion system